MKEYFIKIYVKLFVQLLYNDQQLQKMTTCVCLCLLRESHAEVSLYSNYTVILNDGGHQRRLIKAHANYAN